MDSAKEDRSNENQITIMRLLGIVGEGVLLECPLVDRYHVFE